MNTKKLTVLSAAMLAVTLLTTNSPLYAQRDAGAKMRGEFGTGFWNQKSRSSSRSYTYLRPEIDSRRSYSYAPARFTAGDELVVTAEEAKIMKGSDTLGILRMGQKFTVRKVEGPWLGGDFDVDGKTIKGWIWERHVAVPSAVFASGESDGYAATVQPQVDRRSAARSYRTNRRYRSTNSRW